MRLKDILPDFIVTNWNNWFKKVEQALVQFTPAYVTQKNHFFSPLVAVIAIIMTIYLIGIAVGAFFTLFASLLVLYFILTKVFGIQLDTGEVFVV